MKGFQLQVCLCYISVIKPLKKTSKLLPLIFLKYSWCIYHNILLFPLVWFHSPSLSVAWVSAFLWAVLWLVLSQKLQLICPSRICSDVGFFSFFILSYSNNNFLSIFTRKLSRKRWNPLGSRISLKMLKYCSISADNTKVTSRMMLGPRQAERDNIILNLDQSLGLFVSKEHHKGWPLSY